MSHPGRHPGIRSDTLPRTKELIRWIRLLTGYTYRSDIFFSSFLFSTLSHWLILKKKTQKKNSFLAVVEREFLYRNSHRRAGPYERKIFLFSLGFSLHAAGPIYILGPKPYY